MVRYKNMTLAYSFQIFWALIWIILIFLYGEKGMLFMAFGALRPLVLERVPIKSDEVPWQQYYLIAKNAAVTTCLVIILFYFADALFLPERFVIANRYNILGSILPLFVFVHGIIGILYNNRKVIL